MIRNYSDRFSAANALLEFLIHLSLFFDVSLLRRPANFETLNLSFSLRGAALDFALHGRHDIALMFV